MQKLTLTILAISLSACGGNSPDVSFTLDPLEDAPTSATLKIEDFTAPEGSASDNNQASFRVSISPAPETAVTLDYTTVDDTAVAGDDYSQTAGSLSFAAGEQVKFIDVPLIADGDDEGNETFKLMLSNVSGAAISNNEAIGTIANDDKPCNPTIGQPNPWMAAERRLINYSHRGGEEDFPENTMFSYKKSVALGADVLEMDVYENIEGELIVIHDATVDRTTNHSGDVSSFTVAELKEMDAAYWFVPAVGTNNGHNPDEYKYRDIATGGRTPPVGYDASDFTIPTLEEILQTFPNELINIELKPDPDSTGSYEQKVADLLKKYGRQDDVIVASFIDNAGGAFKAAAPCVSTSFSTGQAAAAVSQSKATPVVTPTANPAGHHAFQVPPSLGVEVVNAKFIQDAHAANIAVHVWTIDDCQQMVDLLNMGVDAIMTDRPTLLEQLLDQTPGEWTCDTVVWPLPENL